ncbi:MAG: hypothetical protein EON92_03840 [Burkholderiales bacterium]|nr:MAG: hypothetical protein EON92_03840 [Burkholderiales bacterium]
MARHTCLLAALLLPLPALCQAAVSATNNTSIIAPVSAPISAIWAGEWRVAEFNLPPPSKVLTTRRDPATFQVKALIAAAECPMRYDGLVAQTDIVKRIEERERFQLDAANWPVGTDPAQFVGLKMEFDQAMRITRTLPVDNYRRVRVDCAGLPSTEDRFYLLNEGRRLFEFRFPDNGLSLSVVLYERAR